MNWEELDYFSNSSGYYWPGFFEMSNTSILYEQLVVDVVSKVTLDYHKWVMSIGGCLLVGLSGIFPLLLFPYGSQDSQGKNSSGAEPKSGKKKIYNLKKMIIQSNKRGSHCSCHTKSYQLLLSSFEHVF
jgi:hypothetical protein